MRARDIPDTCDVPWRSTGWTNNKNVQRLIGFMVQRGEVAAVGREGSDRLWDLAERVYPDDPVPSVEEARAEMARRNLRSLGLARPFFGRDPVEPETIGDIGQPVVIEGLRGEWRADPELLDQPFRGRAALLSPLDRLVYDRKRMVELFDFDYQLEMYKPAAKRRWGYWAMPILYGDRLVGKLDCHRRARRRRSCASTRCTRTRRSPTTMRDAVNREIKGLAKLWLGLEASIQAAVLRPGPQPFHNQRPIGSQPRRDVLEPKTGIGPASPKERPCSRTTSASQPWRSPVWVWWGFFSPDAVRTSRTATTRPRDAANSPAADAALFVEDPSGQEVHHRTPRRVLAA